jgi:hypothetical protein
MHTQLSQTTIKQLLKTVNWPSETWIYLSQDTHAQPGIFICQNKFNVGNLWTGQKMQLFQQCHPLCGVAGIPPLVLTCRTWRIRQAKAKLTLLFNLGHRNGLWIYVNNC